MRRSRPRRKPRWLWFLHGDADGPTQPGLAVGQDKLIEDVLAVNPNTVVVLNSPLGVTMPWLAKVKAVLEMWFPGRSGRAGDGQFFAGPRQSGRAAAY